MTTNQMCCFCVRGRCDGIVYNSWCELNGIRYGDSGSDSSGGGIHEEFTLIYEQRRYLSTLQFDIVRSIAFHYCECNVIPDNVDIIDNIIFHANGMYKESVEENEQNAMNHIIEDRNYSWNHIMKMVTDLNDYKNYNEETFSEQRIYLSSLPIEVVRAIGIIFCNGRKCDNLSVIITKIYLQLKVIYQNIFEENIIEENIAECNNSWDHIINMVSENEYRNYNQEMFFRQYRYISTLPIDVLVVMAYCFCEGRLNDEISVIIEKIHLKLITVFQEKTQEQYEEQQQEQEEQTQENDIPTREELIPAKWIIHPLLICLETEYELQEPVLCAICLDSHKKIDVLTTNCEHEFCKKCMCDYLDSDYLNNQNRMPTCAMCRTIITTLETKDVEYYDEIYQRYTNKPPETIGLDDMDNVQEMIEFLDYYGFVTQI